MRKGSDWFQFASDWWLEGDIGGNGGKWTDNMWKAVKKKDMAENAEVLSTVWAMKLKANGTQPAQINARGYKQIPGEHYDETGISWLTPPTLLNLRQGAYV